MKRLVGAALVVALLFTIASPAMAKRKPRPLAVEAASSIAVVGDLRFGGEIRFDTSTDYALSGTEYLRVSVTCWQEGAVVWGAAAMPDESVVLGSGANLWHANGGGPADCEASLWAFTVPNQPEVLTLLAVTSFHAEG